MRGGGESEPVTFDPSTFPKSDVTKEFRIFTSHLNQGQAPAVRIPLEAGIPNPIIVYVCGEALDRGKYNARAGKGIYYGPGNPENGSYRTVSLYAGFIHQCC